MQHDSKRSLLLASIFVALALLAAPTGSSASVAIREVEDFKPTEMSQADAYESGLRMVAKERGTTLDETAAFLEEQQHLMHFADQIRERDGYLDFMLHEDGMSGELVVEPDFDRSALFRGVTIPPNVDLRISKTTKAQNDQLVAKAIKEMGDDILAATFDVLENKLVVAVMPSTGEDVKQDFAARLDSSTSASGSMIEFRDATVMKVTKGGQRAWGNLGCTTGYGVKLNFGSGQYGYITAGHCGQGSYNINNEPFYGWSDYRVGAYHDRIFVRAGGSSYLTQVSQTSTVDMESYAGHIYSNSYICHFGKSSNTQRCGSIYAQNQPVLWNGITVWVSLSPADCEEGDSGGPAWNFSNPKFWPRGMIEAAIDGDGNCGYLSIDDQLSLSALTLR